MKILLFRKNENWLFVLVFVTLVRQPDAARILGKGQYIDILDYKRYGILRRRVRQISRVLNKVKALPPLITPPDSSGAPFCCSFRLMAGTATLNHIRSLLTSGFASLHHPRDWSLLHVRSPSLRHEYEAISQGLSDALDFTRTIGLAAGRETQSYERGGGRGVLGEADLYTSWNPRTQEVLQYFRAFPFLGDRTRQLDGAHIEYFRGIRNPIGIKVGPSMAADELVRLLDIVNPEHDNGRVTLITRYGVNKIATHLPIHIKAVQASGHPVIWVCDPMHGNTLTSSTGLKTRHFGRIISELTSCLRIHSECGLGLGGVSLEFTGELNREEGYSVTECLGGSMELSEEQLGLRYQSFCDPRLNFEQSLDVAFLVSNYFNNQRRGDSRHKGNVDVLYSELGGNTASAAAA
ncbi:class-II DAHP synthetase family-domain-containing protein [Lactarius vividus]|nr:class-II DAHP synthetase family-domain-containing protein [Lactarius vividus]